MRHFCAAILMLVGLLASEAASARPDPLCKPLREFLASLRPHETHEFVFHTSWGGNFKDDPEPALRAKRCMHNGYKPAKDVCDFLMEHGATEFSDSNVKKALVCLSSNTRFSEDMQLGESEFHFHVGTEHRGSLVDVKFVKDPELGGMAFHLKATGY